MRNAPREMGILCQTSAPANGGIFAFGSSSAYCKQSTSNCSKAMTGSSGYVVKDNRPEIIVDAVNRVAAGESYMTDEVRRIYEMRKTLPDLTPRELELLQLMARGLTNKDISSILKISIDTVKSHLRHVFAKMDVETRAEAVSEAIRRGLATS